MKKDKCDKCCIGYEDDWGVHMMYEDDTPYELEGFEFCPHCGFELPEYVRPKSKLEEPFVPYDPLSVTDGVLKNFYFPLIKEQLKPSMLSDLIDRDARKFASGESFIKKYDQLP